MTVRQGVDYWECDLCGGTELSKHQSGAEPEMPPLWLEVRKRGIGPKHFCTDICMFDFYSREELDHDKFPHDPVLDHDKFPYDSPGV